MSPRRKSFQPANVAEARALRMTPWRRAFGRRRGRRLWKLTLGVCFLLGLSLGYRLFVTPSVSTWRLIPPEPLWLLEVRKAASYWRKYAGQRSIQGLAASPLLDPLRRAPDWMLLEEALRPDPAAPPDWSRLPWLLGEETTVALYHRGAGDTQLFIASRLHPLVRLRLAWEMLQPARRRTWRVEPHDSGWKIGALDPPFYFVLYGRLLVAANDPTLLAAGEHRIAAQAEPFEELATDTGVRAFLEDLPPDRLGFFLLPPLSDGGEACPGVRLGPALRRRVDRAGRSCRSFDV
ncbi:MAG: hypothetical protein KatS3mg115_1469 [Candidatus Poribacteria bacterium]|nr:MAG: hypothetical protein KatS3mg115_1469 [Candidatus Poribacteria bacterium]